MSERHKPERVSLRPSGLNYWRPFHVGQAWIAGCLPLPIIVLGIALESQWLLVGGSVLSGVAQLLAIRSQRDAFFTPTRVHHRRGLLGLTGEDVPIRAVDQVLVESIKWLPEMGHLTLQCGTKYLRFECVPNAEDKARQMLAFAQAARERQAGHA